MKPAILLPAALALVTSAAVAASGLAPSPESATPIGVGTKAPDVRVVDAESRSLSLAEVLGGKPTILIFYRGGWCPYCNKHLAQLAETERQLVDLGYQVVGISPDPVSALHETAGKSDLAYRLYSDRAMEASSAFGLAFRVDRETVGRYKEFKIDLAPVPGEPEARWLPIPAAIVVDASGTIRFVHAEADYKTRIAAGDLLAAARAALE